MRAIVSTRALMRRIRLLIQGQATIVMLLLSCGPVLAQCEKTAIVNNYQRSEFVRFTFGQQPEVTSEFLVTLGCAKAVERSLAKLGAKFEFSDERVGYIVASLPRERLLDALDIVGISYAAIPRQSEMNKSISNSDDIAPFRPETIRIPAPEVSTAEVESGPYFPAEEAGLRTLWLHHSEADGRGVRIAVVDDGFDLLHPAIQWARKATGEQVRKIVDIDVGTTPDTDDNWVLFGDPLNIESGVFVAAGHTWKVPGLGQYRFGLYRHTITLGYDADSKIHPAPRLELNAGVLWDEQNGFVWIDSDRKSTRLNSSHRL